MIRILWFFILMVVLYWALKKLFSGEARRDRPGTAGEEMVKDPNCGVYLPRSSAICFQRGKEEMFFCSEKCREEYKEVLSAKTGYQD